MDGKAGILFAIVAALAGFASGRPAPSRDTPRDPVGRTEEDDGAVSLAHVSCVYESSFLREGRRTTVVVLDDGRTLESDRHLSAYGAGWPSFALSVAGRSRQALVNPGKVLSVSESTFRRTNREHRETMIELPSGFTVVVQEPVGHVRRRIS